MKHLVQKTVILVGDLDWMTEGIKLVLESRKGYQVRLVRVGEEGDLLIGDRRQALIVVSLIRRLLEALDCVSFYRRRAPDIPVFLLYDVRDRVLLHEAFRLGISGCLETGEPKDKLLRAIDVVFQGDRFIPPSVLDDVFDRQSSGSREVWDLWESLTVREKTVLSLVGEGNSPKQIARILEIGVKTVQSHIHALKRKLRCDNYFALLKYAYLRDIGIPVRPVAKSLPLVKELHTRGTKIKS